MRNFRDSTAGVHRNMVRVGAGIPLRRADLAHAAYDADVQLAHRQCFTTSASFGPVLHSEMHLRPKALENHLIGPARGTTPFGLGPDRPRQYRHAKNVPGDYRR